MNKKGATIIEYALIVSLVVITVVSGINKLKDGISDKFVMIDNEIKKNQSKN